jgi:hypothetical protein
VVPGPGEHSPDYKKLIKDSPRFGFGSGKRGGLASDKAGQLPGPGNYDLGSVTGKEGRQITMHSVIKYDPEHRE